MLSKLFRSRARFDDPDPEVRRRSVVTLTEEDAASFQADLAELAASDADVAVRRAAIGRLTEPDKLAPFLASDDADLARLAAEGIAVYGTDPNRFAQPEIRNAAIRTARDPDEVSRLIGEVGYDTELIQLAVTAKHAKVRLAAAEKLIAEHSLAELERASRDRDKNVNRLARTRLDTIKHAKSDAEKADRRAHELVKSLEAQLRSAETDPLFAAKLGLIRQDFASNLARHREHARLLKEHGVGIAGMDEVRVAFDALVAAAENALPKAPVVTPEPTVATAITTDTRPFAESLAALSKLHADLRSGARDVVADYDAIHTESVEQQDHWLAAADHAPPPEVLARQFHEVTHALKLLFDAALRARGFEAEVNSIAGAATPPSEPQSPEDFEALWQARRRARGQSDRLARVLDQIAWPADHTHPAIVRTARGAERDLAAIDVAAESHLQTLIARVEADIARLSEAIGEGNLSLATSLEAEGRRLLKSLPPAIGKRMQGEFNGLAARVLELKDWVTYATHPKREQLTAEMEALAQTPLAPPLQAEKIRELREMWKGLGQVTSHADRRLFDRFNAAAETAFAPCRAYFEEQGSRRKFNLEQRRKICDELAHYIADADWAHADWRAAERILRAARDEWRKFHPVDRSPGRKVQTRFEGLTAQLYELIKAEWDRNIAIKQGIVKEAQTVRDSVSDMRDATDRIKTLQRHWREVGITPRRVDQSLWREFRAICDAVFGRRDAAMEEVRQASASLLQQAEQLLDEYQSVFDASGPGNADPAVARDFADRFNAMRDLPREAVRRLEGRFREIDKNYRVLLRQARHRRATAGIDRLERIDAALSKLEIDAAATGLDTAGIEAAIAAIPEWEEHAAGPFADRVRRLRTRGSAPVQGVIERRRSLAIEMEIVAGLETPPEDQSRRLALQVERLNQKHRQTLDDDPQQMAERWCRAGPVERDDPTLRARFFEACRHTIG